MKNNYAFTYKAESAPKLGLVTSAVPYFSEKGKEYSEGGMRQLFNILVEEGYISSESIFYQKRISGYHQAAAVAEDFAAARVDVILIFNSAFPDGFVFPVIAMHPSLKSIPVIVAADEEPNEAIGSPEWVTNSVCGNDMNNYVAKYLKRYVRFLDGSPVSTGFQNELKMLLNVYRTVKMLRHDYLVRFGDAPGGFHSANGDQLLYFKTFGTTVCSVELLRVKEVYDKMEAIGEFGKQTFSEDEIVQTAKDMAQGRLNLLKDQQTLYKGARYYHALLAIIKVEGFTSAALKCWPELAEEPYKLSPCLSMAWAISKGDVTAFACESDWPGAIMQTMGKLLTGVPAAFMDFVNWNDKGDILQLGHCGIGIPCIMEPTDPKLLNEAQNKEIPSKELRDKVLSGEIAVTDAIIEHGVSREAGIDIGPSLIGQFQYGVKTGFDIIQTPEGKLKLLVFTGESSPDTAKGILYSACDMRVKDYKKIFQLKREHGFSHHLVVAMGDISRELKELCIFYGIEYISPEN
jgi:L-fucose isomerase-like protein